MTLATDHEAVELSIVVCTRNRSKWLPAALSSLAALESARSWEVLLVDNASTDDTAAVIARADDCGGRLRYMRAERIGLGAARDCAWRTARGAIVAFTDDDCYPARDFVDAVLGVFDRHPAVGCLGGRISLFDPNDEPVTIDERPAPVDYAPRSFIEAGQVHGANISLRRSVLEAIGGFDPDLGAGTPFPCEDIDVAAATLAAGAAVRYDPAPRVAHHHRRRAADMPALWRSYDAGRGAYYAKYVLRPDTRMRYALAWLRIAVRYRHRGNLVRLNRELRSAFNYLRHRRAYRFLAFAVPSAVLFYGSIGLLVVLRTAERLFKRGIASIELPIRH